MSKRLERYISKSNFNASDEELRELCKEKIGIFYGFNTYSSNVKHIHELCAAVRAEYPDVEDEEMGVWYVLPSQSIRHAHHTMLFVRIPIEDFIRMRNEHMIRIL